MVMPVFEALNRIARKRGIHSGIPYGAGREKISTRDKDLQDLLVQAGQPTFSQSGLIYTLGWLGFLSVLARAGVDISKINSHEEMSPIAGRFRSVNTWTIAYHPRHRCAVTVCILRDRETGRTFVSKVCRDEESRRFVLVHNTLELRSRYSFLEIELRAQGLLREALTEVQWEQYVLADAFIEKGRSGVEYIIRKGRPTIAFRRSLHEEGREISLERVNPLGTLCLHPLAYYTGTWAGVMPPSDEALSHLLAIRDNEHRFWKEANVFRLEEVGSGI